MPLIGNLGIGTVLAQIVTHLIMKRRASTHDRLYQEKRKAYSGLLASAPRRGRKLTDENSKVYALWQIRCALFGSTEIIAAAQEMIDTNDAPSKRLNLAFRAMCTNLGALGVGFESRLKVPIFAVSSGE